MNSAIREQQDSVFIQRPSWSVALLMIGACVGAVATTAAFLVIGLVKAL